MVVRNNHSKCIILAGVNGAGKSTLFDVYLKEYDLEFVNADVIAKSLTLPKDSYAASVRAGKIALTTLREFINNKVSFIFETTLTSHQSLNLMREAKANGFEVTLHYVALQNLSLSINRVAERVSKGGHDIPIEALRRRFSRSFANLPIAMSVADNIIIFDNSHDKHQLLYAWHHGEVIETIPEKDKPDWLKKVIAEYNILNADISK